jgi:protein with PEP-CTERM/exosortase system signal
MRAPKHPSVDLMKLKSVPALRAVYLALAFIALAAFRSAYAVPVVLNGSFESPAIAPNFVVQCGGDFWTGNNGSFIVSNNFQSRGTTPFGNQYLGLNGSTTTGTDEQNVPGFLAGHNYLFDLFFADSRGGPNPTLSVTLSGAATGVFVFTAPVSGPNGNNPIPFQLAEVSFTPSTDGSVDFLLSNIGGDALAIDNVSVREVPDAGSSALLLGLALLGVAGTKRVVGI